MLEQKREYVLAVIVVAALVAVAWPNFFAVVQKSKATQAVATLVNFESPIEECLVRNSDITPGIYPCKLSITPLGIWAFYIGSSKQATPQTSHFGQIIAPSGSGQDAASLRYSFVASDGINTITLTRTSTGQFICQTGTKSPYLGAC